MTDTYAHVQIMHPALGHFVTPDEAKRLRALAGVVGLLPSPDVGPSGDGDGGGEDSSLVGAMLALVDSPDWAELTDTRAALRGPLERLCAAYLYGSKRGIAARDPVANFHLRNGARMERHVDCGWWDCEEKGGALFSLYLSFERLCVL